MSLSPEMIAALIQDSTPRKSTVKRKRLSRCENRVLQALILLGAKEGPRLISQTKIGTVTGGMLQPSISLRLAALQAKGFIIINKPGRTNLITVLKTSEF